MQKRGQISVEYLIVIGFVVLLVIGALGVAMLYSSSIRDNIRSYQLTSFANKVISASESVFYAGEPSKSTFTAYLPAGVEAISIIENNLVFNFTTSSGLSVIAFESNVPISGSLQPEDGVKKIQITALETEAEIRQL